MDSRSRRPVRRALAMCCLLLAVAALVPVDGAAAARARRAAIQGTTKDASFQRLNELAGAITRFRERLAADPTNTQVLNKLNLALAEYDSISAALGGDQSSPDQSQPAAPGSDPLGGPIVPPNCVAGPAGSGSNVTPVAIPDSGGPVATSTIVVAGAGPYLYDVTMVTNITHTFPGDLDMTLQSPAGTIVTFSSDNGGTNDNCFAGTTWNDDVNPGGQVPYTSNDGVVGDHLYGIGVLATPLAPEEAFTAFVGEDPNGTWTITIDDDAAGDTGTLNSWSLNIETLAAAPVNAAPVTVANMTPVAIPDSGGPVATSTIVIAGAGTFLCDVDMFTNISHTFPGDLDMTLQSPAGTIVTFSSDNAGTNDNAFGGTTWNDDANPGGQVPYVNNDGLVSDHLYAVGVPVANLAPEEPFGAFIGEDPNGTWTITIDDDAAGDTGTLNSWSLSVVTCMCMVAGPGCTLTCPADITTTAADLNGAVVTFAPTAANCVNVQCTPPSGSTFPVGTTVVTCTGEDDVPNATRGTVVTTYSSGNIAVPLPDVASMTPQVINVADMGTVLDVDLRIRLNHTFDNDLDITLTGPNAVTIDVSSDNGGSGDNYGSGANDCSGTPTVFDDEAATGIASGVAPFAGSFIPEVGLSAFDGIPAAGNWTLNIADDLGGDVGTLFCYELVITRDIVVGGGGSSCQFNVNVTIPFDSCCIDDASGDIFRQVVASVPSTSPLYGYWEYEVAATAEIFAGIGNHVAYRPGLSIIIDDNDDPAVFCHAEIDFPRRKCRVQVRDITTGRNFVLRDRNINNNMCAVTPPPM
ncbi:MAG: proprotein convertase P-domain-containing protein [Blastocatellia bacterium]|nr:proprotein convertase P-domain-containing protein [Blastocatellia bacterium]